MNSNEEIEIKTFLEKNRAQEKIEELSQKYANKKIVLYGAGIYADIIFQNYDLSKLNIIAIADKKFEEEKTETFYNIKCIEPNELKKLDCDVIFVSTLNFAKIYCILKENILINCKNRKLEVQPLIKTDLGGVLPENICKNKICARPYHIICIYPNGYAMTCCSAYINDYVLGNILNKDLNSIWTDEKASYLRKALLDNNYSLCNLKTCIQLELMDKEELLQKYYTSDCKIKTPDTIYMTQDFDCNVACITCRNKLIKNDEETLKKLKTIEVNILNSCKNAKTFYASGNGDPFGSKYARELLLKVAKINPQIKFFIHTNGILCTEKLCDELTIKDRINDVIFSIHAAKEETYNKIVRFGNFKQVIKNMEWISKLKQYGQIKTFTLAFVVHKFNYQDMPDFVRLAETYGATASFRYYRQWSNNTEYKYDDMAIFDKKHKDHQKFINVIKDDIFDSKYCKLDPLLSELRNN